MLAFRQQEMFGQRTLNEELAVPEGLATRLAFLLRRSAFDEPWAARRLGVPIEGVLMAVGVGVVVARGSGAGGAPARWSAPEAVLGTWLLVMILGTAPNLGIDWDRYYLPIVALGLICAGVGTAALVDGARRIVSRRRAPTSDGRHAAAHAHGQQRVGRIAVARQGAGQERRQQQQPEPEQDREPGQPPASDDRRGDHAQRRAARAAAGPSGTAGRGWRRPGRGGTRSPRPSRRSGRGGGCARSRSRTCRGRSGSA